MAPRPLLVLVLALLLAPGVLAQNETADPGPAFDPANPPYRATGQWILYLVIAGIGLGLVGAWWVSTRYEP